jgi:hypothetical protein
MHIVNWIIITLLTDVTLRLTLKQIASILSRLSCEQLSHVLYLSIASVLHLVVLFSSAPSSFYARVWAMVLPLTNSEKRRQSCWFCTFVANLSASMISACQLQDVYSPNLLPSFPVMHFPSPSPLLLLSLPLPGLLVAAAECSSTNGIWHGAAGTSDTSLADRVDAMQSAVQEDEMRE